MLNILNLFGRSPFAPLQSHMGNVAVCVHMLSELFEALLNCNYQKVEGIAEKISENEHLADLTKNDIRNHLPKTLFLPIDRSHLLEILSIQDRIADAAEDVAILTTLKSLVLPEDFKEDFQNFLKENIETFDDAYRITKEIHELLESSFGGIEAQKVQKMVETVSYREHEADLLQRKLLRKLYSSQNEMSFRTFDLWQRIFHALASISNLSENLANRIRMTLELK